MVEEGQTLFTGLCIATAAKYCMLWYLKGCDGLVPVKMKSGGKVARITLFPLKSAKGIDLPEAVCTFNGLQTGDIKDRTWMVVFGDGNRFVTGRQEPSLTLIKTTIDTKNVLLDAPNCPQLRLPIHTNDSSAPLTVKVWGEEVDAVSCGPEAADWISNFLQKPGHKIISHPDNFKKRKCIEGGTEWHDQSKEEDQVSFADGFPYMLMSEATLEDLNSRLKSRVSINNFRPNIVVTGCDAFNEDDWKELYIGETKFTNIKPCQRCILTTVDPEVGRKDPHMEPLKTLRGYRLLEEKFEDSPCFGINLVLDRPGVIKVGDSVLCN